MFLNRESELAILNKLYSKEKGVLFILYGQLTKGTTQTERQFVKSMTMNISGRADNPDAVIFH
jgi:AAA+ ATPase superfamily predicted ATPase